MKHKYGKYYSVFLRVIRTGKNVSLEQLGWGLCSASMMNRIEEGKRLPGKMMRDRLMDRLGVANDGFEDYLQPDEYASWKVRQELLQAIENKDMNMAERIIRQYERYDSGENAVERQFYLAMKEQVMRHRGASDEELRSVLKCAIELTMPGYFKQKGCLLAAQEWNLLLEYIYHGGMEKNISEEGEKTADKAAIYKTLLKAIKDSGADLYSQAKIYPKAAYYLCLELMKKPRADWDCDQLLRVSHSAVEILRSVERMYYLCELLEIEELALVALTEQLKINEGIKSLFSTLEQVREWRKVLTEVYRDGGISKNMENDCYLYWQTQNYCFGDVVRKRRKMLGMSIKELCEGICDERTVRRLESNKTSTQVGIIGELFERLGLCSEYQRRRIVTDRYEAISLYDMATKAMNNRDTEILGKVLPQLRELLPMELTINRQEVEFIDTLYQYRIEKITKEECVRRLKQILEYTISLEHVRQQGECYLSCGEMTYLYNIAMKTEGHEKKIYMELQQHICRQLVAENGVKAYINTYEMMMYDIASYLGDIGEYEKSNKITDSLMRECLSMRRMNMLNSCIYNRWWNQKEYVQEDTSVERDPFSDRALQKCIQLARLRSNELLENFYRRKLESSNL